MIKIDNKFNFKEIVYIVTDPEQAQGIITGIHVDYEGTILYGVSRNGEEGDFYDFELSRDKDPLKL